MALRDFSRSLVGPLAERVCVLLVVVVPSRQAVRVRSPGVEKKMLAAALLSLAFSDLLGTRAL
jgi:hypothetical protein